MRTKLVHIGSFYTQELLHRDAFTQRSFYTEKPLLTASFYRQPTFTHRSLYTEKLLHTEAFTQRSFYSQRRQKVILKHLLK